MTNAVMPVIETPVLVVGAGPVGLMLAADLGWRGVPCLVVDPHDGQTVFPATEAIFVRTMEHLRRLGLAHDILHSPFPLDYPRNIVFCTRIAGHLIARFERDSNGSAYAKAGVVSPEAPVWCPKMWFDPTLERYVRARPSVRLERGWRVESIAQDAHGVEAQITRTDGLPPLTVRARYLVACDGGRSTIRRQLGIGFDGQFAEGQNYSIYFRSKSLLERQPHGRASQFLTLSSPHRSALSTVNGDDLWRLSLYVQADEVAGLDPKRCIREAFGGEIDAEVLRAQTWYGHRVVAQRYREGRVFLAGDAAHMLWPKGGFGANTGFGDATDLAWMIEAVLAGWGHERLLDAYDAERRPIGLRNVNEAASNRAADGELPVDPSIEGDGTDAQRRRAEIAEVIRRTRWKEWNTLGVQLGYRYADSPIIVPDGTPEPPDAPSEYVPTTWPGCRAPHAWIEPGRSMLDLYGRGFVLLTFDERVSTQAMEHAAALAGVPLAVHRFASRPDLAERYERALVLVRPDGHVAWRGHTEPQDAGKVFERVRGARVDRATRPADAALAGDPAPPAPPSTLVR